MIPIKLKGANREVGRQQGFVPIWIRDTFVDDIGTKQMYPCMEVGFMPTKEEIQKLILQQPLIARIVGVDWPPISFDLGDDITNDELAALKAYHRKLRAADIIVSLKNRPVKDM